MNLIKLPGLVDIHVHLREPGQTHKEDFHTGTSAALAGGYTSIFDMPNNTTPTTTLGRLEEKFELASKKAVCDIGFHFGSMGDNLDEFAKVKDKAFGLKLYLNVTTGNYLLNADNLEKIYRAWPAEKLILLHAESDIIATALEAVRRTNHPTHVCHVSGAAELKPIIKAKAEGLNVTCGVCPHHMFLIDEDKNIMGPFAQMKPELKSQADQDFLWANLNAIDVFESDHAPHTKEEKEKDGAFGVPGLETTLPLLLQAEREGKISRQQIINKCATRPREILNLQEDENTYIEVEEVEYKIENLNLKTKAGWSPFAGRNAFGKIQNVFIRGQQMLKGGQVIAQPGDGRVLSPNSA